MPIPQKLFFLVGRASCPSNKFMKRTFARGLLYNAQPGNGTAVSLQLIRVGKRHCRFLCVIRSATGIDIKYFDSSSSIPSRLVANYLREQ